MFVRRVAAAGQKTTGVVLVVTARQRAVVVVGLVEFASTVGTRVYYFQLLLFHHYDFAFVACVAQAPAAQASREFLKARSVQTFVPSHVRIQRDDLGRCRARRLIRALIDDCTLVVSLLTDFRFVTL